MFKSLTAWAHWSAAHLTEAVRAREKKTEGRRSPSPANSPARSPGGCGDREGRGRTQGVSGGQAQAVGLLTDGGMAWGDGGVVVRGGRAAAEDERDGTGHQSPRRECHWVLGALGSWFTGLIGLGWSHGEEFWPGPVRLGQACRRRLGWLGARWREGKASGGRGRCGWLGGCSREAGVGFYSLPTGWPSWGRMR